MESQVALPVVSWAAWRATDEEASPQVAFIDPQIRRRLSLLDRIALHVAHVCVRPGEDVRTIFASRHGELARSAELLSQLAHDEMPSPMAFSLSVLNAAIGLYGMARKDRSASSALAAGEDTFPMALVEAAAQAWDGADGPVVLTYADEPPPELYRPLVDSPRVAHGIAVRLDAKAATRPVVMSWQASEADEDAEGATQAFLACVGDGVASTWQGVGRAWSWKAESHA
ncbi:MAG: beta-ketoacyl synthase chain length factor [Burkholderiales bacterium]